MIHVLGICLQIFLQRRDYCSSSLSLSFPCPRQCIRLIDETSLSRLVMPMMELIRAGGGTGASAGGCGSSAGGGTRGTGATSTAAIATATCIFLSHLALSSSTLISQPLPPCKLILPFFFNFRPIVARTLTAISLF